MNGAKKTDMEFTLIVEAKAITAICAFAVLAVITWSIVKIWE